VLISNLINDASPFIHADVCTIGGAPIVCRGLHARVSDLSEVCMHA
jgi:hypothetical protein